MSLQQCSNNAVTDLHAGFNIVRNTVTAGFDLQKGDRLERRIVIAPD